MAEIQYLNIGLDLLTLHEVFDCSIRNWSMVMFHIVLHTLHYMLSTIQSKGHISAASDSFRTRHIFWLKHSHLPTAHISRFAICVCICVSVSLFLCINSVPFSCRLTSERLVYFCWAEKRWVFIPLLLYLQFFLVLSSSIFLQTNTKL